MHIGQYEAVGPTPTSTSGSHFYDEQPGLELDSRADQSGLQHHDMYAGDTAKQISPDEHQGASGLQIAAATGIAEKKGGGGYFSDRELYDSSGLEATPPAGGVVNSDFDRAGSFGATDTPAATKANRSRRRLWIILGAIAFVVVVVGAAVGGVLGSRAARPPRSNTPNGGQVGANSSNSTTPLKTIRPGSRLAVTGWRDGSSGEWYIRLFYQGPDQLLRYSNVSSMETGWNKNSTLLDEMEYKAKPNTSLAAATSVEDAKAGEWKLFYFDDSSTIRQQIFPTGVKDTGKSGDLNSFPQEAAPGSRLGAYWPFVLSQDVGGKLRWTRYWGPKNWVSNTDIDITASPGSGLVVIPAAAKYKDAGGLVYRRGDGKPYNYLADRMGNNTGFAWASGDIANNLNGLTIPPDSPLAAFSVARSSQSNDSDAYVNTYILYADTKGAVNMIWQNDQSGWQGPKQYAAFDGADDGTDITCLTPAAWDGSGVEVSSSYDTSRCYFQAGGAGQVREVQFDGTDWKDLGYLPIE
ncbi:hypothetical protein PG996_002903 [Apiospora saccharicola]|uniref:Fucose-specific lectin n=1 Tax=Apiospora saccharicola TaxID=335842 RepID=A0ABR1WKU6_9PEZI